MESLVIKLFKKKFKDKRILIFGNSGFVGSWLSLAFKLFGAKILGISLKMNNTNYLSNTYTFKKNIKTINCDLRNLKKIEKKIKNFKPQIIIHLAAQPIVKIGFLNPMKTYETNIIGTIKILEIIRKIKSIKKILVFTSDKVYSNNEKKILTEASSLGGLDPYSASKSAQDIISQSYSHSFFNNKQMIILRSGNIIGGGDWSDDRIIPDIIRSYFSNQILKIRSINSTRPWIHIFDVINAIFLILVKRNLRNTKTLIFNLSPNKKKQVSVKKILYLIKNNTIIKNIKIKIVKSNLKEKKYLRISSNKAFNNLNWKTKLNLIEALKLTIKFYLLDKNKIYNEAIKQIKEFFLKKA
ncbi:CDP-glucose 4,6-dehydratase [Candidatus Pelagibacter sp.]|jgi:CDP-glucose 4,6-dehydratase|nr:CDP-glucose 4,6-dehydratase [Candidatus Pelagibacter sp.]